MYKKRSITSILIGFLITAVILVVGYIAFGFWTALIFTSGFFGGFVLWLFFPSGIAFQEIKKPYWIAFSLFLLHRVEEKVCGFFDKLSDITHVPTPEITSVSVISLVVLSVGAWFAVPILIKRGINLGYYLAWTFFTALGVTELAHFIFPFFMDEPYGYFPGMASVIILAPVAWWGMYKLAKKRRVNS